MKFKVTVFSTSHCSSCIALKQWLDKNQIDYQAVNLDDNPEQQAEIFKKSGVLTVPITLIVDPKGQEQIVIGPQYGQIKKILGVN